MLGGAVGFLYSAHQQTQYAASASVSVQDPTQNLPLLGLSPGPATLMTPAQTAAAHSGIVTRPLVVTAVRRATSTKLTEPQLAASISTAVNASSNLLAITATATDAGTAAELANAFAQQDTATTNAQARQTLAQLSRSLQHRLRSLSSAPSNNATRFAIQDDISRIESLAATATPEQVVSRADVPSSPTQPKTARNVFVGLLLGLLLGIIVADIRRSRDRRLRTVQEVERVLPMPVVGHIAGSALGSVAASSNGRALTEADLETFRILRQNLQFLGPPDSGAPRTIVVTSPQAEAGKSTVASFLACANAAAGRRTLLVECDVRRPVLAERLGIERGPGLCDYLVGAAEPEEVLQVVPVNPLALERRTGDDAGRDAAVEANGAAPNGAAANGKQQLDAEDAREGKGEALEAQKLVCITAGNNPVAATEYLTSTRFRSFIEEVSAVYDSVILDAPPLLPVVDALELVPLVSGVLVCVRVMQTTRDEALATNDALTKLPERPTALVLTNLSPVLAYGNYYSFYDYR